MTPRPTRLERRPLLGATALVVFAAVAAFAGCSRPESQTIVARVGKGSITAEEMEARLNSLPPQVAQQYEGEEGRKLFLEGWIEEEAWVQAALGVGIEKDEEVQRQLEDARRRVLIQNYFARELQPYQVLTEDQIRKYYDEEIENYTKPTEMKVRHVETTTRADAERARRRILSGESMAKVAEEMSKNEHTSKEGGLIGYVAEHSVVIPYLGIADEVTAAIDSLPVGELSGVLATKGHFHVLRVEEIVPTAPFPFDKVKETIRRLKQHDYETKVRQEKLDELKAKLGVTLVQAGLDETRQAREAEAEHLFQQAQESTEWQARLDLYNKFLEKFPDHNRRPEALFMIGFIYAEELKDFAKAQDTFNKLLAEFPEHKLAKDARFMLDNLGATEPPAPGTGPGPASDSLSG